MIGLLLLLLNNHQKFKNTMNNISFTTKNLEKARSQNKKYYSDMNGNNYDVRTGHLVCEGRDKYTGHRGIIDAKTGRAVEDYVEKSIKKCTDKYLEDRFPEIKRRLDSKKKCLSNPHEKYETLCYSANNKTYVIYWDNEVKRFIDVQYTNRTYRFTSILYTIKDFIKRGYSEEELYEYYCWRGENPGYPIINPTNKIRSRIRKDIENYFKSGGYMDLSNYKCTIDDAF